MHTTPGPRLALDWEEGVFRALRALWRRLLALGQPPPPGGAATLEPHLKRLQLLASLIAARPIDLQPTTGPGGLRGELILLPQQLWIGPDPAINADAWLLRVLIDATAARLGAAAPPDATPDAAEAWTLAWAGRAVQSLQDELPGFGDRFAHAAASALAARPPHSSLKHRALLLEEQRQEALRGRWPDDPAALTLELAQRRASGPPSPPVPLWGALLPGEPAPPGAEGDDGAPPSGREVAAPRPVTELRRSLLKEEEEDYNPIIHTFEKIETLDEQRGGYRQTDGTDELDDHMEALEEVDLREVFRGGAPAEALLKVDLPLSSSIPDVESILPGERGVRYDEWDYKIKNYKKEWCTVYPTPLHVTAPAWGAQVAAARRALIDDLYRQLDLQRSLLVTQRRQREGEEIDLDAAIHAWTAHQAGEEGEDRLYLRRARRRPTVATVVLLDLSLSTDAWVEDRRVLDVAREAVVVLGEVAERLGDDLAVLAFASKTRNACRVWELKRWSEPWRRGRDRLGTLSPQGYTRIGPALRHATATLGGTPATRRLVLLLSDGKPTDFDRYEGRYGISDVRMALREANAANIHVHALTIDARARPDLAATFGPGGWGLLRSPDALPRALTEVYGRLSR